MNDQPDQDQEKSLSSRRPLLIVAAIAAVVLGVLVWGQWQERQQRECQSEQLQAALEGRPTSDC